MRDTLHYTNDGHGNIDAILDGENVREYHYDAYGNESTPTDGNANPYRYCSENFDAETGLYYLRNRYYDPELGRFLTEDPAKDGDNWFVYCGNNPVTFVDPTGLKSWVFYDGNSFGEQAKTQAEVLKKNYGTDVEMVDIWSSDGFMYNWWLMTQLDNSIDGVTMLFHGTPFTIYLGEGQQLTTSTNGISPAGYEAIYIGDMPKAKMKMLNIMTCNGGHLDYIYSTSEYIEREFHHNIAVEFLLTHEVSNVYAMDGNLSYTKIWNKYYPRLANDQYAFYDWMPTKSRGKIEPRNPRGQIQYYLKDGQVYYKSF